MSSFETVRDPSDPRILEAIDESYLDLARARQITVTESPLDLAGQSLCIVMSTLIARKLLERGVYATREDHDLHYVVGLSPEQYRTREEDLIICATWGQYNNDYRAVVQAGGIEGRPAYTGPRDGIRSILRPGVYEACYGRGSIYMTQHTFSEAPDGETRWLVQDGRFPEAPGEIDFDRYPPELWYY